MTLAPPTENNLPKIRELSDFNEIFSVYLSKNDLYNTLFILFQNLLIFFRSFNFDPPYVGGVTFFSSWSYIVLITV